MALTALLPAAPNSQAQPGVANPRWRIAGRNARWYYAAALAILLLAAVLRFYDLAGDPPRSSRSGNLRQ